MSRIPLIVANWKMYKTPAEARAFIEAFIPRLKVQSQRQVFIAPSFTCLEAASLAARGSHLIIGAQTMHEQIEGAFTGETSIRMLKALSIGFVILGHSERRQQHQESDFSINKKIHLALQEEIIPILCIGESLTEREENRHHAILKAQLGACLAGLTPHQVERVVIAYEPIWAIGTGKTATAQVVQETHQTIRLFLEELYGISSSQNMRILYGGSVKPENMASLMEQADIDGALVGGASLDVQSFINIVNF